MNNSSSSRATTRTGEQVLHNNQWKEKMEMGNEWVVIYFDVNEDKKKIRFAKGTWKKSNQRTFSHEIETHLLFAGFPLLL